MDYKNKGVIEKKDFARFIANFNEKISFFEGNRYKTTQHLIDEWDKYCDTWIKHYDIHIENVSDRLKGKSHGKNNKDH